MKRGKEPKMLGFKDLLREQSYKETRMREQRDAKTQRRKDAKMQRRKDAKTSNETMKALENVHRIKDVRIHVKDVKSQRSCHPVILSFFHPATLPFCHPLILSFCHPAILPSGHPAVLPSSHPANLSSCHYAIQPSCHPAILPSSHSAILPSSHPAIQSSRWAIQSSIESYDRLGGMKESGGHYWRGKEADDLDGYKSQISSLVWAVRRIGRGRLGRLISCKRWLMEGVPCGH